ncbi:hypothetical protein SAMN02910293_00064 [Streptococcus henryi]|uniref:Uncharacterized protein n=1 Tax=Streptococcus henryi TaxID=439219 RepID=A0A1G6A079_9STRE|nr:hypothetical protein [Streptococcus henryi]SDB01730.1 hypothetical protein SAMN02910293_00064 [Streptococcus henryi]
MIGDYSIMDLATFLTALIALFGVLNSIIRNSRDTSAILREFEVQSKEMSHNHSDLKEKTSSVKGDTEYICNELRTEQKARENLYQNTTRAKEILETMDMMKEVVIQNSKLNAEVAELKVENQNLLNKENDKYFQLTNSINSFKNQLAKFEEHGESEDIRVILRKIEAELSEYVD